MSYSNRAITSIAARRSLTPAMSSSAAVAAARPFLPLTAQRAAAFHSSASAINSHRHGPLLAEANTDSGDLIRDIQRQIEEEKTKQPPSIRNVIVRLLQTLSSKKDVAHYLRQYAQTPNDASHVAVIKVGGGLIQDELETLVSSLSFLVDVGLMPVVVHGAGPQLNAKLKSMGIESDYHGGIRVTTPTILKTAKQTFQEQNIKLCEALELQGVRCRGFVGGVFGARMLDFDKFGYVGDVESVDTRLIKEALHKGVVPIITCMAEDGGGQLLNVNADVAAHQLAKEIKPGKIIYLSQQGGLKDNEGKLMSLIDLETDYQRLMNEEWFTKGNRLKLKEIKTLLDALPLSSSVSITSAEQLPRELFTYKGSGTLVKRTETISFHSSSLQDIDLERLRKMIETSFDGTLDTRYMERLETNLAGVHLSQNYSATAVVTDLAKESGDPTNKSLQGVSYLDKFAVDPQAQGTGTAQRLWDSIRTHHQTLVWRSRQGNQINAWYFDHCEGSYTPPPDHPHAGWTVFWYGLSNMTQADDICKVVLEKTPNLKRHSKVGEKKEGETTPSDAAIAKAAENAPNGNGNGKENSKKTSAPVIGARAFSTYTRTSLLARRRSVHDAHAIGRRSFSTSSSAAASSSPRRPVRVGLIGARGHTGAELIQLLARNPNFELVSANSRAVVGKEVREIVPQLNSEEEFEACTWKQLKFGNVQPDQIAKYNDQVDLWILALPNGVAKPFIAELEAEYAKTNKMPKLLDLSADYRFDPTWTYGFPEKKGSRSKISSASRIANPGCYATAMEIALLPLVPYLDPSVHPSAFGVSGYSGAGTTPSRKNDAEALRDNLMPYAPQGHIHEREVELQLRQAGCQDLIGMNFVPHVAPHFRGITMTVTARLNKSMEESELRSVFRSYFAGEPLIQVVDSMPEVASVAGTAGAKVSVHSSPSHPGRVVVCSSLDNLMKGAASQAQQNINLMFGFDELAGIKLPKF